MVTSSKSTAAKKTTTASKSTRSNPAQDIQDAMAKPFKGMTERLQNLKVSGAAGALIDSGRKDLQALVQANEKSYKGLQAVVQRQTELLKSSIGEWQGVVKAIPGKDPKESFAQLDAMGKAAFKKALDDIKELSELAAKSQADAFNVVRERINDNVEQARKMLQQPRK